MDLTQQYRPFPGKPSEQVVRQTKGESLRRAAQPTLVYGNDLPGEMLRAYSGKTLKLGTRPLDLDAVAAQADFAILNGNHATCGQLLLRGVPALNIPLQREQQLFSQRAAATGACLTALPEDVDHMVECLNALAEDIRLRAAAAQFASEKSDFDIASVPSALAAELTALL